MKTLYYKLTGKLDTTNAGKWYRDTAAALAESGADCLELDCEELIYITSAGLRQLLAIQESGIQVCCTHVSQEVYETFDMTGLSQILLIQKKSC